MFVRPPFVLFVSFVVKVAFISKTPFVLFVSFVVKVALFVIWYFFVLFVLFVVFCFQLYGIKHCTCVVL